VAATAVFEGDDAWVLPDSRGLAQGPFIIFHFIFHWLELPPRNLTRVFRAPVASCGPGATEQRQTHIPIQPPSVHQPRDRPQAGAPRWRPSCVSRLLRHADVEGPSRRGQHRTMVCPKHPGNILLPSLLLADS
jgi:hypothetical protein